MLSIDCHSTLDEEQPQFLSQQLTVADVVNVNCDGNAPFLGPVLCIQSIVLTMKGG